MKRAQIFMSKPVYLDLSILEISKIAMCEFWYDYVKPKYNEKAKLCYMDQDSLIAHIKTEDNFENFGKNVEKRFDTSNYRLKRPQPKVKAKKLTV